MEGYLPLHALTTPPFAAAMFRHVQVVTTAAPSTGSAMAHAACGLGPCNGHWATFDASITVRKIDLFPRHKDVQLHTCDGACTSQC
jgi:hypothetical protein